MKRACGVLMHVSSLFGDYSIGGFGDSAKYFIDFLADSGFSYWQVLPFCYPDDYNSPYKSYSAFGGNPYFIDLECLYKDGLITKSELEDAKGTTPYVSEFDKLKAERIKLLFEAAKRAENREEIEKFIADRMHLAEFCIFMAKKQANSYKPWKEWTVDAYSEDDAFAWKFIQYTFHKQWANVKAYAGEKGVKIIGDIPIYVDYDSADVYFNKEQFLLDKDKNPSSVAGVPPDYFCEDGQLWGNPLYDWKRMKKDGFAWWKSRLEYMFELFDGVRIDHFRGIEAFWSVPNGAKSAKEGKWVKGPGKDFVRMAKAVAGEKLLIAEDLGDIDDAVRALVEYSGFPGMRVIQFAFDGNTDTPHLPFRYNDNCISYTGTHDNNTLLGYIWELDEYTRRRLFEYCGYFGNDWDEAQRAVVRTMYASHSPVLIMPIQDLLNYGADTRMNTPGKSSGNWEYRVTKSQLDEIDKNKFRALAELYGRI